MQPQSPACQMQWLSQRVMAPESVKIAHVTATPWHPSQGPGHWCVGRKEREKCREINMCVLGQKRSPSSISTTGTLNCIAWNMKPWDAEGEALAGIPLPIIIKKGRKTASDWKITQITAVLTQSAFADQRQDPVRIPQQRFFSTESAVRRGRVSLAHLSSSSRFTYSVWKHKSATKDYKNYVCQRKPRPVILIFCF